MEKNTKTPVITIDGTEYLFETMSEKEQAMVNHVADLDRKIHQAKFNLDQLQFGRESFFHALKTSLETPVSD